MKKLVKNFLVKLTLVRPIARQKRIVKKLELRNKRLEKKLLETNRMLSIISHDLRSPFNAFLGFTNELASRYDSLDDTKRKFFIGIMHRQAENVFTLLNNLLDWSKIKTGSHPVSLEKLQLRPAAQSAINLLQLRDCGKEIEIINEISDDTLVEADPNIVTMVIRNLISNSLKFTHSGGTISISENATGETIAVSVKDTGVGIKPENMSRLFGSNLYSTPGTCDEKGTGLGLLLCKEMIERQGGKIFATSTPGQGTIITFTLKATNRN